MCSFVLGFIAGIIAITRAKLSQPAVTGQAGLLGMLGEVHIARSMEVVF
jgi:hypothetical protein